MTQLPLCPGFEGNPAFYGLGIRLGVYLQLVSSWISNTQPRVGSRYLNHDANSIFVFAIVTAVLNACNSASVQRIEAWIMRQACFAFYFKVLAVLGLRIHFLSPLVLLKLVKDAGAFGWQGLFEPYTSSIVGPPRILSIPNGKPVSIPAVAVSRPTRIPDRHFKHLDASTATLSFGTMSFWKHRSLSWARSAWRMLIAALLVSANIGFGSPTYSTQDSGSDSDSDSCSSSVGSRSRRRGIDRGRAAAADWVFFALDGWAAGGQAAVSGCGEPGWRVGVTERATSVLWRAETGCRY
jgi:hypothetical protein